MQKKSEIQYIYSMRYAVLIFLVLPICSIAQQTSKTEEDLQRAFLTAENSDTIYIPRGEFYITRTLWLDDADNVVIIGAGNTESILDFSKQIDGAEGIKVTNSRNIKLLDFAVKETKGDGIKVQETTNVSFENIKVEWEGKPDKKNGAYGIYPVLCKGVYIFNSEASGASDAGIYVGQSEDIIVTRCIAYNNVAGIEIENSERADVYDNTAYGNTGGILVFDLPDLQKKKGGSIRVFQNIISENNLKNFAPKGNIVAKVPQGTGILILATEGVEVFENQILNNRSIGLGIISYYLTELPITDTQYDPVPKEITVHNNKFVRQNVKATSKGRFGKMFKYKLKFGKEVPHILWDGITDGVEGISLCIKDNSDETFAHLDAENDFKNISLDISPYLCTGKNQPPVRFDP